MTPGNDCVTRPINVYISAICYTIDFAAENGKSPLQALELALRLFRGIHEQSNGIRDTLKTISAILDRNSNIASEA